MQPTNRFCSFCGSPLNPQARFCGSCGHPVQPAAPAAPQAVNLTPPQLAPAAYTPPVYPQAAPQPQPPAERVMGVIPMGYTKSGLMGVKTVAYSIVLTNYRVIFAHQTAQSQTEQIRQAREAAKAQGKGFFGQWGSQMGAYQGQQYLQMDPNAIVVEQPDNFYVLNNQIHQVKLHTPSPVFNSDMKENPTSIEFDSIAGKTVLYFNQIDENKAKQLLKQVLGSLVH